jgi:hypothetical protein
MKEECLLDLHSSTPNVELMMTTEADWPKKGIPEYTERWRQSMRRLVELGVPIPESWFTRTSILPS